MPSRFYKPICGVLKTPCQHSTAIPQSSQINTASEYCEEGCPVNTIRVSPFAYTGYGFRYFCQLQGKSHVTVKVGGTARFSLSRRPSANALTTFLASASKHTSNKVFLPKGPTARCQPPTRNKSRTFT